MKTIARLAAVSVLTLALAACGGAADDGAEAPAAAEPASEPADEGFDSMSPQLAFEQNCTICHSIVPGENLVGPSLTDVFGAAAAQVEGFSYTPAMRDSGLTWDEATLDAYLSNPSAVVPGTNMSLPTLPDEYRAAIIAHLKTL